MVLSTQQKFAATFALYFIFFGSGITYNTIGPTLTELKDALNATVGQVSGVYTARSAGYIIGAPLGALLFSQINRQLCISIFVAIMSICAAVMPFARPIYFFYAVAAVSGMTSGGMEAGVNVWLLEIWGDKSCPYMQALHLCFSLGCAVAPLFAAPFLSSTIITLLSNETTAANETTFFNETQRIDSGVDSRIEVPYLINGGIVALASLVLFTLYCTMPYKSDTKPVKEEETEMEMIDSPTPVDKVVAGLKNRLPCKTNANATDVVIFACLTMLFYSGMSIIYSQFMPTYLQNFELKLSKQTASYINSAMYYASTISRALSVPLAMKFKPEVFVYTNCFMLGLGSLLLLFFGGMSLTVTWVGNIFIGIGSASVSAPMYSFLKQHIEVTNTIGSIFVFSSGLTSVIYPVLVGYFIEKFPEFLLYLNVINIGLTVFFFTLIYVSARQKTNKRRQLT